MLPHWCIAPNDLWSTAPTSISSVSVEGGRKEEGIERVGEWGKGERSE